MKLAFGLALCMIVLNSASAIADDLPFPRFVDDYFAARFADKPSEGTAAGFHEYDDKLEDLSKPAIEKRAAQLKGFSAILLAKLRKHELTSPDDVIDAVVIEGQIMGELLDIETLRTWESNPMGYVSLPGGAIDGLMKRDFAPKADRLKSVIARLKAVPALHRAAKENVKNPPKEFTDLAIRMAKGSVGFFKDSCRHLGQGRRRGRCRLVEAI